MFVPRGADYLYFPSPSSGDKTFAPAHFDADRMQNDFGRLADRGFNAVRMFLDLCRGSACIENADGGLDQAYLEVVADVMQLAGEAGIFLLLTSNDLPESYQKMADVGNGPDFPGYRNTSMLTSAGHEAMKRYWDDLLTGLESLGDRSHRNGRRPGARR